RRDQSGEGAQNGVVAESTATAQGIWQIQISSCTAHCRGVSQVQAAKQRNRTVQTLGGSRHLTGTERQLLEDNRSNTNTGPIPTAKTSTGHIPVSRTRTGVVPISKRSTGMTPIAKTGLAEGRKPGLSESGKPDLTQIQLGCISHCFGTTSRTPPQAPRPTLQQLRDRIAQAMPSLHDVPAAEQNAVAQTSHQWQYGSGLGRGQTQTASQLSTTAQSHDLLLAGAARSALGDHVSELVNQTEQGIWQLQIGCLAFCSETRQIQQAEQSNTTMHSAGTGRDSSSYPLTSSVNITSQTVWQVQVGCLTWCFDTEQQQTASSENIEGELPGQEAAGGVPPPAATPPRGTAPRLPRVPRHVPAPPPLPSSRRLRAPGRRSARCHVAHAITRRRPGNATPSRVSVVHGPRGPTARPGVPRGLLTARGE